ncbi:MAG: HAMP domain-containing protein [Deltaproteobacteria bacterium]|nr:HAMP domain-containing protein [Deltaproteobacteria bacterium]
MVPGADHLKALFTRKQRGLRWEILVSLGLLVFGGVAFMGTTALKAAERTILIQKMEALTQVTRSLQAALAGWWELGRKDPAILGAMLERTARGMDISSIVVTDSGGKMVAGTPAEKTLTPLSDSLITKALQAERIVTPGKISGIFPGTAPKTWTFYAPIFSEGDVVGAFSASFPLEGLGVILRVHRKIIYSFAILDAFVILLFGIWLIGRVAIRPMLMISEGARALAAGDYGSRVVEKGPREIVELARSFNEMAAKIEGAVRKQDEHMSALEKANHELQLAQQEMVRYEKLASVGNLSSGIAHEIGNPLSAILGYAGILLKEEKDPERGEYLMYIERETERIQRIIRGLLEFSRPHEIKMEVMDINDLVGATLDLVSPQKIFSLINVEVSLARDLPPVHGDRHHLQQALVNILLNAAQAMGGEGDLDVTTSQRKLSGIEVPVPGRRATDHAGRNFAVMRKSSGGFVRLGEGDTVVTISIRDSGPGTPREIISRVFDPFFTTKEPGEGTGLGLSIAFGIVQSHGGRLQLKSEEGHGTEVIIDLPAF